MLREKESQAEERLEEILRLRNSLKEVVESVKHDSKTGALTDSALRESMSTFISMLPDPMSLNTNGHRRNSTALSGLGALFIDIDKFKLINDNNGHAAGDRVLRKVIEVIKNNLRDVDIVGRFGGDEFVVIMPQIPWTLLRSRADEICRAVSETDFDIVEPVTLSIGSTYTDSKLAVSSLLNRADEALYRAKNGGRNQVVHSE